MGVNSKEQRLSVSNQRQWVDTATGWMGDTKFEKFIPTVQNKRAGTEKYTKTTVKPKTTG